MVLLNHSCISAPKNARTRFGVSAPLTHIPSRTAKTLNTNVLSRRPSYPDTVDAKPILREYLPNTLIRVSKVAVIQTTYDHFGIINTIPPELFMEFRKSIA